MFNFPAFYRTLSPEGTRGGEFQGNRLISGGLRLPRGFPEAGSGFSEGSLSLSHYGTEQPDCKTSNTQEESTCD